MGFLHRPLLAALVWAGVTSNTTRTLGLGVFFELLWLDLFPAGTFIPPQALFSLAASLSLLTCLPDADMRLTTLVILCTLPLAHLGAWIEQLYRKRQNLSYNALIVRNRKRKGLSYAPRQVTFLAVAETFLLSLVLFLVCVSPLLPLLKFVRPWVESGPQPTWPLLWICACIGAILSLRIPKAEALAVVVLIVGILGAL